MEQEETCLEQRPVFEGKLLKIRADRVRLPGGGESTREVVIHPGAIAAVPVTADGKVVLVRQWRYAAGQALLEIPAGTLEPGEVPEVCAQRELAEEIGQQAGRLEHLASFYAAPGYTTERIHLFLARDLRPAHGEADADEAIELEEVPLAEAQAMIADGRICDGKTIAGLLLALARLGQ